MHFLAEFVAHQGIAEERFERLHVFHHGAHRQEAVKPVAELTGEAFQHQVGGDPFFPVVVIAVVVNGGVGDDTRVEPGIADVGHAALAAAALGALKFHFIDPGAVRAMALELFPAFDRAFLQFFGSRY